MPGRAREYLRGWAPLMLGISFLFHSCGVGSSLPIRIPSFGLFLTHVVICVCSQASAAMLGYLLLS